MAKKKNNTFPKKEKIEDLSFLPKSIKGYLLSLILVLLAAIILFSFFNLAGKGGQQILAALLFLFGQVIYLLPLFLVLSAAIFFVGSHNPKRVSRMTAFAFLLCSLGLSAILNSFGNIEKISLTAKPLGGFLGYFLSFPILKFFGFWVNLIVFILVVVFGFLIFWQISKKIEPKTAEELTEKDQILKRILEPKLRIREIPGLKESPPRQDKVDLKTKPIPEKDGPQTSIKQASRDMLLSLRKEIGNILQKIVAAKVSDALTAQTLTAIITDVAKRAVDANQAQGGLEVTVSAQDLQNLQQGFIAQLQKELKKPIHFKASEDIGKGFVISFDQGKSNFDFSDAGLADYLGAYLNEQVAALLKEAAKA